MSTIAARVEPTNTVTRTRALICSSVLAATSVCFSGAAVAQAELETTVQKFSYNVGMQIGRQLKQSGLDDLDLDALRQAIEDTLNDVPPRVSEQEARAASQAYQAALAQEQGQQGEVNLAAGKAFLEQNKSAEGVQTTASGLQYRIVTEGEGEKPSAEDSVVVHYRGKLLDGTEFDSSFARGEPASFTVGQVIPGWQEVLQLMNSGAEWEVWIPSELAYGERGAGGSIGPHQVLNFTIQLIGIKS